MTRKKDKIPRNQGDFPACLPSVSTKSDLASLFGSDTRARVIWAFLERPDLGLTPAEIAHYIVKDPKAVQRALDMLEQIELVFKFTSFGGTISPYVRGKSDPDEAVTIDIERQLRIGGGPKRYRLNQFHPWVPGLRIILENSYLGSIQLIKNALLEFPIDKRKPYISFVFGSFATGEQTPESDIDLIVIGSQDKSTLADIFDQLEQRIGRQINYIEYTREEWKGALEEDIDFARSIMAKPKVFLIGDNERLERISKT